MWSTSCRLWDQVGPFGLIPMRPKGAKRQPIGAPILAQNHRGPKLTQGPENHRLAIETHGLYKPPEAHSSPPGRLPLNSREVIYLSYGYPAARTRILAYMALYTIMHHFPSEIQ
ncbi:hypothetical protein O181_005044 [Austropuccinia psidii MF-1]|uniref:Uncharacterized protein n=1 Tax=Austropuccinia psidii MF-1 TaxID=1389203 RepID=A0A9Q3BGU6_9BASI|nr:hypothetical protein [Austropuccinia psidii MF-1]